MKIATMIAVALAIGFAGSLLTTPGLQWYSTLNKPFFTPPAWVFAPAWTILYILMGTASGIVWKTHRLLSEPMRWYFFQLLLNFSWSAIFFGLQLPGLALICIGLLWASIYTTMQLFRKTSDNAYRLMVPYLAWVTFASLLNFAVLVLN